jgi:hypothetical protein
MMGESYQIYEEEILGFFLGGGEALKKQTAWKA